LVYRGVPKISAGILNYLASLITRDTKCTPEMKSRIAIAKVTFNKKKIPFA